jgi:DNA-binding TFAR19-related protein (PDSD5 family)
LRIRQLEEQKQAILVQILAVEARDRCTTLYYPVAKIKLVKPDKVAAIENSLIAAAQQGKLRAKISEEELVAMLESQSRNDTKITVKPTVMQFKRRGIDDEW